MKTFNIGISGHRDLKKDEILLYMDKIEEVLNQIIEENRGKHIVAISPLAQGADQIFIRVAKDMFGLRYKVILPMDEELYKKDFTHPNILSEFNILSYLADSVKTIPLCEGNTKENIAVYGKHRDLQYKQVGLDVVDKSDVMIFLYDGIDNGKTGGAADILKYAKSKNKPFHIIECKRENKI